MSSNITLEGEINISAAENCVKQLGDSIDKGVKAGVYSDMSEVVNIHQYYVAMASIVKHCDNLQKKLKQLISQQEILRQADTQTTKSV